MYGVAGMHRVVLRCAAPSLLLATLVLVPFLGKAFTIDDTFYLAQARHALTDPLHPASFEFTWVDAPERMARIAPSGPLAAWLLMPSAAAGGAEWIAHLLEIVMLAAALLGTVALALRFGLEPNWATVAGLLVAVSPAALGMAGTAMPDVPAMAFGVLGLERLVAWRDQRRLLQGALAALLLGVAPLARSHLFPILLIGALFLAGDFLALRSWREIAWTRWLPLAAAPLLTISVLLVTRDSAGGGGDVVAAALLLSSLNNVGKNAVAFLTHWVLALPLALPWVVARPRAVARRWWVFVPVTVASAFILHRFASEQVYGYREQLYIAPIAGLGATVLWDILADAWKQRDHLQLALGLWLLTSLAPAPYVHLPSKYLLMAAPAAALLVAREMSKHGAAFARLTLTVTCVAGLTLGIAILRADAAFAGVGRRAAAELIAPEVNAGRRVWFAGHWGFQWYAEKAGGRILTVTPPYPARGDLVAVSMQCFPGFKIIDMARERFRRARPIRRIEDATPGGRLMYAEAGVGFYSNLWGYLPWVWSSEPIEAVELWQLE
jgi:4-amino-4-deoxy-L-arabinose transferase-like glycosyltransferase